MHKKVQPDSLGSSGGEAHLTVPCSARYEGQPVTGHILSKLPILAYIQGFALRDNRPGLCRFFMVLFLVPSLIEIIYKKLSKENVYS